jgi:hypothetical protein
MKVAHECGKKARRAVPRISGAVKSWKVRGEHLILGRQAVENPPPVQPVLPVGMQQHHRGVLPAMQNRPGVALPVTLTCLSLNVRRMHEAVVPAPLAGELGERAATLGIISISRSAGQ